MNTNRTIVIGADHAGYLLKEKVCAYLTEKGFNVINVGTDSSESCDYPVFAGKVCKTLQSGEADLGILVCGTGVGMSMAANKYKGIRAACCSDTFSARLTRVHNDANVLCFGERVVGEGLALDIVDAYLGAEFEGGKHKRRIAMFENGVE
ncbi:MAG: ribose 5-phosphate isomerase B [Clostridia bacterium]|nr:ribose 5-phosphate isomerase B [Clostridia bacterium]